MPHKEAYHSRMSISLYCTISTSIFMVRSPTTITFLSRFSIIKTQSHHLFQSHNQERSVRSKLFSHCIFHNVLGHYSKSTSSNLPWCQSSPCGYSQFPTFHQVPSATALSKSWQIRSESKAWCACFHVFAHSVAFSLLQIFKSLPIQLILPTITFNIL